MPAARSRVRCRVRVAAALAALAAMHSVPGRAAEPPRLQELLEQSRSADPTTSARAVARLADYGPLAAPAVADLTKMLASQDVTLQYEAARTLGRIGPAAAPAVPALVRLLDSPSPLAKHGALEALRGIGPTAADAAAKLKTLLDVPEDYIRVAAARALLSVMPQLDDATRQEVLDQLATGLTADSSLVAGDAAAGLARLGPEAVPALLDVFKDDSPAATAAAADALSRLGVDAASAIPELLKLAKSGAAPQRKDAIGVLGAIASRPEAVVPPLTDLLSSEESTVRNSAILALANYGVAAKPAVPKLRTMLADEDESVRMTAADTLAAIGPEAAAAVPDLLTRVRTDAGPVALAAARALSRIGKPAVPGLVELLGSEQSRRLALVVLEQVGTDAADAAKPVAGLLASGDEETERQAAVTLAAFGPEAKAAVPALRERLRARSTGRTHAAAIYALGAIAGGQALPDMRKALASADPFTSIAAAYSIASITPDDEAAVREAVPRLLLGLQSERPRVRAAMAKLLGRVGKVGGGEVVGSLRERLADPSPEVQAEAAAALGELGASDKETLTALALMLDSPYPRVRYSSLFAVGRLGAAAKSVLPAVEERLESPDPFQAAVAAWAATKIAPTEQRNRAAVPKLVGVLRHPSPAVRSEAARTLAEIAPGDADAIAALEDAAKSERSVDVRDVMEKAIEAARKPEKKTP